MAAAEPKAVASGTADVQAYTGACQFRGYSLREAAGSAAVATVILRDGTSTAGAILAVIELAADGSETISLGDEGVNVNTGIFVDRVTGTTEGTVYIG